jgi:endoglucanase
MNYPFWINDFDRIKNYRERYPLAGKIFEYPQSFWYGDVGDELEGSIRRLLKRAEPHLPILVTYNIPNRDVGHWSKGGAGNDDRYLEYIETFARGVGDKSPIIIYEPDALPHSTLLSMEEQDYRLYLMKQGLEILTNNCNGIVYVDVGHSAWLDPKVVVELLNRVSNPKVRGFSINSSNYRSTEECIRWGRKIRKYRPNDRFVIDTSRNGNGPSDVEWCNPSGRAIGHPPSTDTAYKYCDAYLWIKIPGESDGKCNGGPKAGRFWGEQAEELVRNSEL